ncbi:MAG TPA: hypothetical protein PLF78_01305 [Caulobacter sp.]|nr:hypothetical protein [Caulobacter sp.]
MAKAIESKVEKMPMADLLALASTLNVRVPATVVAKRLREPSQAERRTAPEDRVLHGGGIGPVVSAAEGGRLLDAVTVDVASKDWIESDVLGAGALVAWLSISRGTLDNWRKAKKVLALRKGLRNFVYPTRQFHRSRPLEGLDLVAEHFAAPEDAWEWLVAPNRMTGGKPPIEALREGEAPAVARAAAGAYDYA